MTGSNEKMVKLLEVSQKCQNELNMFKKQFLKEMKESLNQINDHDMQKQTNKFVYLLNKQSELNLKLFKENLKIYKTQTKELNVPSINSNEEKLKTKNENNNVYLEEKKVKCKFFFKKNIK